MEKLIGFGGMGRVYRGMDEILMRPVALKKIKTEAQLSPLHRTRFLREARILSKLDHPNICRIYDLMESRVGEFLVLEFIDGVTLREAVKQGLPMARKLEIAEIVVGVLEKAHQSDIIHRDICCVACLMSKTGCENSDNASAGLIVPFRLRAWRGTRNRHTAAQCNVRYSFWLHKDDSVPVPGRSRAGGKKRRDWNVETKPQSPAPFAVQRNNIKPENVMIARDGAVKVLDFGLGREFGEDGFVPLDPVKEQPADIEDWESSDGGSADSSHTTEGSIVGTLRYISPEGARGEEVTRASDMYSFGILLQELMTEESAYGDLGQAALLMRVSLGKTRDIPADAKLHPRVVDLIDRLTHVDPTKRPTAAETAAVLRGVRLIPIRREQRRRRIITAILSGVFILTTAFVTWMLTRPRSLLPGDAQRKAAILPFGNQTGDPSLDWVESGLEDFLRRAMRSAPNLSFLPRDHVTHLLDSEARGAAELGSDELERLRQNLGADLLLVPRVEGEPGAYRLIAKTYDLTGATYEYTLQHGLVTQGAVLLGHKLAQSIRADASFPESKRVFSRIPFVNQAYAIGLHRLNTLGALEARDFFAVCLDLDPDFPFAHLRMAECLKKLGEFEKSRELVEDILNRDAAEDDRELKGGCLFLLGRLAAQRGEGPQAEAFYLEAAECYRADGDLYGQANVLRQLGTLAYTWGEIPRAMTFWRESMDVFVTLGDALGEAKARNNLGVGASALGDLESSNATYNEALALRKRIGDREGQADCYNNLGGNFWKWADFEKAESYFSQAYDLYRELKNPTKSAQVLQNLSECAKRRGDLERATQTLVQSLEAQRELGNRVRQMPLLLNLSDLARMQGQLVQAEAAANDALTLAYEIDSLSDQAGSIHALAMVALDRGDLAQASEMCVESRRLYETLGFQEKIADVVNDTAEVCLERERWARAESLYFEALSRYEALGIAEKVAVVRYNLANFFVKSGRLERAAPFLEQAQAWFGDDFYMALLKARYARARGAYGEALEWAICAQMDARVAWTEQNDAFLRELEQLASP